MSEEHNRRVNFVSKSIISISPCNCVDEDGIKRSEVLFRFYKQAHTVGVLMQFLIIALLKVFLLVPVWGAVFGTPWDFVFSEENDEIYYIDPTKTGSNKKNEPLNQDYKPPVSNLFNDPHDLIEDSIGGNGLIEDDNPFDTPSEATAPPSHVEPQPPVKREPASRNELGIDVHSDGTVRVPAEMEPFADMPMGNTEGEGQGLIR